MRLLVLLAVSLLALGGCAGDPVPADRFYRIEVPPPAGAQPINAVIGVDPVRAGGIYSERPLLYLREGAVEQRRFDFWADAPDKLLEDALLGYLRGAIGADHVVTAGGRVRADFDVRTRLVRLEQLGDGTRMALQLEFIVRDPSGTTVADLQSGGERAISGSSPQAFVDGVEAQAHDSFVELEAKLRALEVAPHEAAKAH